MFHKLLVSQQHKNTRCLSSQQSLYPCTGEIKWVTNHKVCNLIVSSLVAGKFQTLPRNAVLHGVWVLGMHVRGFWAVGQLLLSRICLSWNTWKWNNGCVSCWRYNKWGRGRGGDCDSGEIIQCDSGENYAFPRIGHFSHARVSNISSAFKSAVVK